MSLFNRKTIPIDASVEAEYADGYIHSETGLNDLSPFGPFKRTDGAGHVEVFDVNILNDIIEKRPEADHGRMVRFSMFYKDHRYDVDWTELPDNARPIRWKRMERDSNGGQWTSEPRIMKVGFGYQYNTHTGANVQEVQELD